MLSKSRLDWTHNFNITRLQNAGVFIRNELNSSSHFLYTVQKRRKFMTKNHQVIKRTDQSHWREVFYFFSPDSHASLIHPSFSWQQPKMLLGNEFLRPALILPQGLPLKIKKMVVLWSLATNTHAVMHQLLLPEALMDSVRVQVWWMVFRTFLQKIQLPHPC